jgi:hypothetical protein
MRAVDKKLIQDRIKKLEGYQREILDATLKLTVLDKRINRLLVIMGARLAQTLEDELLDKMIKVLRETTPENQWSQKES